MPSPILNNSSFLPPLFFNKFCHKLLIHWPIVLQEFVHKNILWTIPHFGIWSQADKWELVLKFIFCNTLTDHPAINGPNPLPISINPGSFTNSDILSGKKNISDSTAELASLLKGKRPKAISAKATPKLQMSLATLKNLNLKSHDATLPYL
jgi:hypothetical protein